jgi:hypothetical protein
MKRVFTILTGLFALFIATGLILPALAKVRDFGAMPGEVLGIYTFGIVLAIAGIGISVLGLWRRKSA